MNVEDNHIEDTICLIVVFNHRYDRNIEKINEIYKSRFQNIYHLVPFFDGDSPNTIPVFESSYYFQGFFSQGVKKFFSKQYSHYVFVADDLLLNPKINSKNILKELNLDTDKGYIQSVTALTDVSFEWTHLLPALQTLVPHPDVHAFSELPTMEKAEGLVAKQGLKHGTINHRNLQWPKNYRTRRFYSALRYLRRVKSTYPAVMGYSDFFIIPAHSIEKFCRFCGIFAAMNLFVEVAIPTAMIFSEIEIVTEKSTRWKGKELWTPVEVEALERDSGLSLNSLSFSENQLYTHPVKLSKWKM